MCLGIAFWWCALINSLVRFATLYRFMTLSKFLSIFQMILFINRLAAIVISYRRLNPNKYKLREIVGTVVVDVVSRQIHFVQISFFRFLF